MTTEQVEPKIEKLEITTEQVEQELNRQRERHLNNMEIRNQKLKELNAK